MHPYGLNVQSSRLWKILRRLGLLASRFRIKRLAEAYCKVQGSAVGALPSLRAMSDSSVQTKLLAGAGMVCVSTTAPGLRIGCRSS